MTDVSDISGLLPTATLESAACDREPARSAAGFNCTAGPASRSMRRLLLVAYQFPPVGGAGVQRVTKFVKYLQHFGWQTTVLTVRNPSVPAIDHSLLNDIPPGTEMLRATTWEPSYAVKSLVTGAAGHPAASFSTRLQSFAKNSLRTIANCLLQPDPQILWVPNAIRMGRQVLDEAPHDAILASGPPFSTFLVGRALSHETGLPLVVDYRDEWSLANTYMENRKFGRLASIIQQRQQAGVLRSARAIIATTRASTANLERAARRCGSTAQAHCIFNGFDPDDLPLPSATAAEPPSEAPLRLVYVGTLWKLTSLAPLAAAIRDLSDRSPDLGRRLKLVVAGRRTAEEQDLMVALQADTGCVEEIPYLDHTDAVELMRSADLLLVTLAGLPGAERVLPAKVFEYLAVRRPMLAIAPRGELWDLLQQHSNAAAFDPTNTVGIAEFLETHLECRGAGIPLPEPINHLEGLDRRSQCGQLAAILEQVAPAARRPA
ncbi:MAG TPA: glycosyltransferase [Planctomycetaceae bacterium]